VGLTGKRRPLTFTNVLLILKAYTMKPLHILFIVALSAFCTSVKAQLSVTLVSSNYHGSAVSCHGSSDGTLSAVPTGGTEPYTYEWSNSATTSGLEGLTAGAYTVTVTDADNSQVIESIELLEPNTLELTLTPFEYAGGTNISSYGLSDGSISSEVSGGTTPYQYAWSNNETADAIENLAAGTYTLTITDMNGCTVNDAKTLTQPTLLEITSLTSPKHNGYEISCNKGWDGQIDLEVSGGIPPYKYIWTNGIAVEDQTDLPANRYGVIVYDANGASVSGRITLTEPSIVEPELDPYVFPNKYNVSCYECANGSVQADATGGISPYSYQWIYSGAQQFPFTGQGTSQVTNLMSGNYTLIVTDANSCRYKDKLFLNQPSKNAWGQNGDANTDPDNQFIGTTDEQDLVFKTNSQERIRVSADGDINLIGRVNANQLHIGSSLSFGDEMLVNRYTLTQNSRQMLSFGDDPSIEPNSIPSNCTPTLNVDPLYRFNGTIQLYSAWHHDLQGVLEIGFDGANSRIEATNIPNVNTRLLINYQCGKDVFVGNGSAGNLTANHDFFVGGNAGIGISGSLNAKLDVGGSIRTNYNPIYLAGGNDMNHGLGYDALHGLDNNVISVDGPELYGFSGGALGTYNGFTQEGKLALVWNNNGWTHVMGTDFEVGSASDGNGSHNRYRALVHASQDKLIINYGNDYSGGIVMNGGSGTGVKIFADAGLSVNTEPANDYKLTVSGDAAFYDRVSIGSTTPGFPGLSFQNAQNYKLAVHGSIIAEEVRVMLLPWPDYVFSKSYSLLSLYELKHFILNNHHLPGIPSSKEVESTSVGLGEMVSKQMEKIEEITLYLIQIKEELDKVKKENDELKSSYKK
jgi:hypothetical protein